MLIRGQHSSSTCPMERWTNMGVTHGNLNKMADIFKLIIWIYFDTNSIWWYQLTHWGRVTHICVGKLSIIGSDNGLSPSRRQAIIWTNAGIFLIGTLGTKFIEISIEIYIFSFKKMCLKMSSGKWRPCCLGLHVLTINSVALDSDLSGI